MQQTIASIHFPTKLDKLTSKVKKLLSEKYKFEGVADRSDDKNLPNDIQLSSHDIQNAVQKSQQMTTKLKLIRTLLGYQYQSSQKQKKVTKIYPEQNHTEEKGVNLKQFVMSMRKKNQLTDKYFKHRKINPINSPQKSFEQQSKNIQQYTDASLKYVHSFLPHQTTLEHIPFRSKKSVQFVSQPTHYLKDHQTMNDRSYQTIGDQDYEINHYHSGASLQRQQNSIVQSKRSLNAGIYASNNSPKYRRFSDNINNIKQQAERVERVMQISKKQSISLPLVQHEQTNQRRGDSKLPNCKASLDIYANRVNELVYKGKYYNKQLKNSLRSRMSLQKTVKSKQRQQKKVIKQLLPTIKQCVPKNRSKQSNVPPC